MNFREPLNELIHEPTEFTSQLNFPAPERIKIYYATFRDKKRRPEVELQFYEID